MKGARAIPPALGLVALCAAFLERPAEAQVGAPPAPEWRWRQVLSVPRIGSRLRAITVDPADPNRIFVGTEEGTLLKSTDGGVTWMEIDLRPFVLYDRSLGLRVPRLPTLGQRTPNNFKTFVDPPWQRFTDRIPIPSVANPFPVKPDFFFAGFLATSPSPAPTFLYDVARSRYRYVIPVRRIALCKGGLYDVIVATKRDVFGSQDDGDTFVRLFANPGRTSIDNLVCNPDDPLEIAVATGIGLFVSKDGGLTFDQDLSAWPGQRATAVAYGPGPDGGARLYSASGSEMFAGQFGTEEGMSYVYPSGDASTAPWLPIRWVATNPRGDVWLATDDGARFSPDYGKTWATAARTLLSRQGVGQVLLGENERGGVRVVLMLNVQPASLKGKLVSGLHDSHVYASDDGGETWHPFFHGMSRRYHMQMDAVPSTPDHPAGWWIVTSGGVYTTYPAPPPAARPDPEAVAWAQDRLRRTPDIGVVLDAALDNIDLSMADIEQMTALHRNINWIPRIDLQLYAGRWDFDRAESVFNANQTPSAVVEIDETWARNEFRFFVQASWTLNDVLQLGEIANYVRPAFHTLRRQVQFAAEDAWHERVTLLRELERGLDDIVQIESLKTRILALEAMLDIWLGEPMVEMAALSPVPRRTSP